MDKMEFLNKVVNDKKLKRKFLLNPKKVCEEHGVDMMSLSIMFSFMKNGGKNCEENDTF